MLLEGLWFANKFGHISVHIRLIFVSPLFLLLLTTFVYPLLPVFYRFISCTVKLNFVCRFLCHTTYELILNISCYFNIIALLNNLFPSIFLAPVVSKRFCVLDVSDLISDSYVIIGFVVSFPFQYVFC